MTFAERYGPWAVVAGGSDGTGAAFAEDLAGRGVNVVLVARRQGPLDELAGRLPVETRTVTLDLSSAGASDELAAATADLDVGLLVYNCGADSINSRFLDTPAEQWQELLRRNCTTLVGLCHHYGGRLVARGRGGVLLVSSGAGWAGGSTLATYSGTKAFDMRLAEGLWAEWRGHGVDVLSLVLGPTDTPSLRRSLERHGGSFGDLADPADVAREGLDHLADGPSWTYGMPDPAGPSPLGTLTPRQAAEMMSQGAEAMFGGAPS